MQNSYTEYSNCCAYNTSVLNQTDLHFLSRMLHHILLINRDGGLMFSKSTPNAKRVSSNDLLCQASILHSVSSIVKQLCPHEVTASGVTAKHDGIQVLRDGQFALYIRTILSGVSVVLVCDEMAPTKRIADELLDRILKAYAECALRDPFYETTQPIRCHRFESSIQLMIS